MFIDLKLVVVWHSEIHIEFIALAFELSQIELSSLCPSDLHDWREL